MNLERHDLALCLPCQSMWVEGWENVAEDGTHVTSFSIDYEDKNKVASFHFAIIATLCKIVLYIHLLPFPVPAFLSLIVRCISIS